MKRTPAPSPARVKAAVSKHVQVELLDDGRVALNGQAYRASRYGPPGGWILAKADGSIHVLLPRSGRLECDCKGWRYRRRCRHVQGIGRISRLLESL